MIKYDNINLPEELYFYMKRFKYGYLTKDKKIIIQSKPDCDEYWFNKYMLQNEKDLLMTMTGNCFDQTEFARIWLENHGYETKSFHEKTNGSINLSHSFVIYKDKYDKTWNWLETSWIINSGIHYFKDIDKLLNYEFNLYLEELKKYDIKRPEAYLYEYKKPQSHISAQEYINNVKKGKLLIKRK